MCIYSLLGVKKKKKRAPQKRIIGDKMPFRSASKWHILEPPTLNPLDTKLVSVPLEQYCYNLWGHLFYGTEIHTLTHSFTVSEPLL